MRNILQSIPKTEVVEDTQVASINGQQIPAEIPKPPAKLNGREKKVWNYICQALFEYGLIHRTDALLLTVVCRTFVRWVEAEETLEQVIDENAGSYMVETPNGYAQPHQAFYVARSLKKELLQWLPEAALTIPAFAKAITTKPEQVQGTLFDDPVEAHQKRHPKPMRVV